MEANQLTDPTDRQRAHLWAKELLSRDNWLIFDTETTGLDHTAEIVQIAARTSDGSALFDWFVKPKRPIPPEATAVHGITNSMVATASRFDEILVPLLQQVGSRDLVIYNAEYDLKMLRQSARAYGMQLAFPTSDRRGCRVFLNGGSILCAMHWYSQWVGDWNEYHGNYEWQKLPGGDHSALGDCKATLEVLRRMSADD